jgi:hypothetical protein
MTENLSSLCVATRLRATPPRFLPNHLNLLLGDEGIGKGLLLTRLAIDLSKGNLLAGPLA